MEVSQWNKVFILEKKDSEGRKLYYKKLKDRVSALVEIMFENLLVKMR
mgnify:CR=1 FL=1